MYELWDIAWKMVEVGPPEMKEWAGKHISVQFSLMTDPEVRWRQNCCCGWRLLLAVVGACCLEWLALDACSGWRLLFAVVGACCLLDALIVLTFRFLPLLQNHFVKNHTDPDISHQYGFCIGSFGGGELVSQGEACDYKNKILRFDGRVDHWVLPWTGPQAALTGPQAALPHCSPQAVSEYEPEGAKFVREVRSKRGRSATAAAGAGLQPRQKKTCA
jgi:hypothetical protein